EFAAVKHLYKVGSGLDSLVIGEPQILGQIKSEYELAKKFNITDTYLNHLCLETIRVSKRVRNETTINQRAVSVSYAAVELAGEIFGSLNGEKVMILGAGENSELVLKNLVNYGVKGVLVANRTYKKGKRLAHKYEGEVIHWESVENYVNEVDIIIASTGAPHLVLNKSDVNETLKNKKGPMFIIDIAVPRDIDPAVKEIAGVHLYNIDNLKEIINKNLELRKKEADKALQIIEDEVENFRSWVRKRKSVPLIKEMRENAKEIKEEEVKRALHRLQKSEDDAEKIVTNLAHRLANKLLHRPTVGLKKIAASGDRKKDLELVKKVFPGCDQY
ncbi:MAG: glutamyl-tRNA reductase, partial [Halanaerobiales bacterium]